nr:ABC transporter permease [Rothia sp. P100]
MTKIKDKSFIFGTLFSLAIIVASILISFFLNQGTTTYTVATTDDRSVSMVNSAATIQAEVDDETEVEHQNFASAADAEAAVTEGDADAYLHPTDDGWALVFDSSINRELATLLEQTVTSTVTAENAAAQGVDLAALSAGTTLQSSLLTGEDNSMMIYFAGFAFAMIFYMTTMLSGTAIANSVVEEKQNRIVEIIATAIPLPQLLAGKIVGNILLAIGQVALYAVAALTVMNLTGTADNFGWILSSAGWFVAFYIAGFAAIATVWAAVGAMSARTEDVTSLSSPLTFILVAALFAGVYTEGLILQIISFIPIISSIAMPVRLLSEEVPFWEPLLALALVLLAAWLLTVLGARIYRNNIMRGGSSVSWKQALKR